MCFFAWWLHDTCSKVSIAEGVVLAGFGKGKFRHIKEEVPNQDSEIEFVVTKPTEQIGIMDGVSKSLGDFMEGQRAKSPDKPVLCYHEASFDLVERKWDIKQAGIWQKNL